MVDVSVPKLKPKPASPPPKKSLLAESTLWVTWLAPLLPLHLEEKPLLLQRVSRLHPAPDLPHLFSPLDRDDLLGKISLLQTGQGMKAEALVLFEDLG